MTYTNNGKMKCNCVDYHRPKNTSEFCECECHLDNTSEEI